MYLRTAVLDIDPVAAEAWYLLMSHDEVLQRVLPNVSEWYKLDIMKSNGQRLHGSQQ